MYVLRCKNMGFVAFILAIEYLLCGLILQPDEFTDTTVVQMVLFVINIIVTATFLYFSIHSKETAVYKKGRLVGREQEQEKEDINKILMLSFLLRIAILLWDVYARGIFILPNSEGDAQAYYDISVSFAFGGRKDLIDFTYFPFYFGQLYKLIGVQKLTAQYINVYLAMWSLVLVYRILCKLNISLTVRKGTMIILCFLPNLMMITTFYLQESVISFCIITALYFFTNWWTKGNVLNLLMTVAFALLGSVLHMGALVVAMGALAMLVVVANKERRLKITPMRIILMVVVAVGFLMVLVSSGDTFTGKIRGDEGLTAESILYESNIRQEGGGAYSVGIKGLPPAVDLIVNTPIRMFYFIFSPVPWMWRGLSDIVAFFGSTIFYIYVVYTAFRAYRAKPNRTLTDSNLGAYLVALTVIMILAAIMFGWGVSNAGSALRHREKFTYICAVMYAVSQEILVRTGSNKHEKKGKRHRAGVQGRKLPNGVYYKH